MRAWLDNVVGPQYASALMWTIAALILLVILLVLARIVRSITAGTFVAGGRNRKTRLAVMDAAAVDNQRRLVLVRRDDVEHLILIGGPTDIVVEQNIGKPGAEGLRADPVLNAPAKPPRQAGARTPPAPPAPEPSMPEGPALEVPRSETVRAPEPSRQRRPAAPTVVEPVLPTIEVPKPAASYLAVAPGVKEDRTSYVPEAPRQAPSLSSSPDEAPPVAEAPAIVSRTSAARREDPIPPRKEAASDAPQSLEEEMSRLLGNLSGERP